MGTGVPFHCRKIRIAHTEWALKQSRLNNKGNKAYYGADISKLDCSEQKLLLIKHNQQHYCVPSRRKKKLGLSLCTDYAFLLVLSLGQEGEVQTGV